MPTEREKDEFWDLEKLLPKRKETSMRAFSPDTVLETVEIRGEGASSRSETVLSFGKKQEKLVEALTYTPEDNPLITSVMIERRTAAYSFYARFRAEGLRRLHFEEKTAEYTPFFSYIPQYSQLNEAQARYYYFFRSMAKKREKVKIDFAYLLLLIYEVLNLPEAIPPREEGLPMLVFLWKAYREDFPKIDKYLVEWLTDYCLLHRLPCPAKELSSILPFVLSEASFKEFYLGNATELSPAGVDALLALASSYHWRHSRYAVGKNLAFYEKHMYCALLPVLEKLLPAEAGEMTGGVKERVSEAFSGSLCSHNIRATIHVIYHPFSHTPRLQKLLTQAVKHADNRIRAHLSIKNRCSVTELPIEYRQLIDAYFNRILKEGASPVREAYEALYDAADCGISFGRASEIELHSWDTTRALVPEDELSEIEMPLYACEAPKEKEVAEENIPSGSSTLSPSALLFLSSCLRFDLAGADAAIKEAFSTGDTLAEEINMAFSDFFGDIILEPTENGYAVIEDYRDEVEKWIEKMK